MDSSWGITSETYLWPPQAYEHPHTGRTRIAENMCHCFSSLSSDTHICVYIYTHIACTHMYPLRYFIHTVKSLCHFLRFILLFKCNSSKIKYASFLCLCFRILTEYFQEVNHFYLSVPVFAEMLMNYEMTPQRWPFTSFQNALAMTQAASTAISTDLVFLQLIFCASCPSVSLPTAAINTLTKATSVILGRNSWWKELKEAWGEETERKKHWHSAPFVFSMLSRVTILWHDITHIQGGSSI